jgi:hypothetical protein
MALSSLLGQLRLPEFRNKHYCLFACVSTILGYVVRDSLFILMRFCFKMNIFLLRFVKKTVSRDSSVDIATRYGLDGPEIESQWGARFSVPIQTGSGSHPASCTMGTGSFPGETGRGVAFTTNPHLVPRLNEE